MAGYVSYEPYGSRGGYFRFKTADGQQKFLNGPQADSLRGEIDAQKSNAAQPDAPQPGATAPTQSAGNDPQGRQGWLPVTQENGQTVVVKAQHNPDGSVTPLIDPSNPGIGQVMQYNAPRAPSKGGLVERNRTQQGGYDPNPEFLEEQENAYYSDRAATRASYDAGIQQADSEHALAEQQNRNREKQIQDEQTRVSAIQLGVSKLEQDHERLSHEYLTSKVDPDRKFSGDGGDLKRGAAAIAVAMGAFGAALTKTPNYALDIVQSAINRDISAQETEIAIKGKAADNTLARLTKKLGSLELARSSLQMMHNDQAQGQARAIALKYQGTKLGADAAKADAQLQANKSKFMEKYRQDAAGVVTKSMVNMPATSGSQGGYSLATPGQVKSVRDAFGVKEGSGKSGTTQDKENAVENTYQAWKDAVESYGGEVNDAGEITKKPDIPVDAIPGADSQATSEAKGKLTALGVSYANVVNEGKELGEAAKNKLTPQIGLGDNPYGQLEAMGRNLAQRRIKQNAK